MTSDPLTTSRKYWRRATLLSCCALCCGILLGGVSAWFLGAVAAAGLTTAAATFNFHVPAAFIRLFAIGRTAARYGERFVGHKAAIGDQTLRRIGLFASMAEAPAVRKAGWQLGDEARLTDYLDDVEDIDYARLRARLPSLTMAIGAAALVASSAIVAPLSLLPISCLLLIGVFASRRLVMSGAVTWQQVRRQRKDGAERLGAALASAVSLKAERLWDEECRAAMTALSQADDHTLALRRLQSGFDLLASLAGPIAGISVVAAAWLSGYRGVAMLLPVALAFAWLALGEAMNGASRILVAKLRRDAAQSEIRQWILDLEPEAATSDLVAMRPLELRHADLGRITPAGIPIGRASVSLCLRAGFPTILVGTSGSGKTSLLKQIAGWIGEDTFDGPYGSFSSQERRALTTLCLHDATVLNDTVRANLFDPDSPDAAIWQALEAVELDARIRSAGGLDAWIRQDMLSLGEAQRLNLARAFLARTPVVLLDEPTEHLDTAQGQRIILRLTDHLADRIVAISTHRLLPFRNGAILELQA